MSFPFPVSSHLAPRSFGTVRSSFIFALFYLVVASVSPARAQAVWTYYTGGIANVVNEVVYGDTQFVFVGDGGNIRTSKDGTSWTSRSNSGLSLTSLVWTGTEYVLVGQVGTIRTSPDASTWTSRTSNSSSNLIALHWSGSLFYAVGGGGAILTSPDAITWTSRTSNTTNQLRGVVSNGTTTVVVGESGIIRSSTNSTAWTSRTLSPVSSMNTVAYGAGLFVAAGPAGRLFTSPDGLTWTQRTTGITSDIHVIKYIGGRFIGLIYGSVMTSTDGITWTITSGPADLMFGLATDGTRLVAAGNAGRVYTSPLLPVTGLVGFSRGSTPNQAIGSVAPYRFSVPVGMAKGRLNIQNARGVTVWSQTFDGNESELVWNEQSNLGSRVPPGVYSYQFRSAAFSQSHRVSSRATGRITVGM